MIYTETNRGYSSSCIHLQLIYVYPRRLTASKLKHNSQSELNKVYFWKRICQKRFLTEVKNSLLLVLQQPCCPVSFPLRRIKFNAFVKEYLKCFILFENQRKLHIQKLMGGGGKLQSGQLYLEEKKRKAKSALKVNNV